MKLLNIFMKFLYIIPISIISVFILALVDEHAFDFYNRPVVEEDLKSPITDDRQCEMTDIVNNKIEFTCKNDLKIIKKETDITYGEWITFRDKNHCRLVKIDETVSENQNHWLCDNNININNDFYK